MTETTQLDRYLANAYKDDPKGLAEIKQLIQELADSVAAGAQREGERKAIFLALKSCDVLPPRFRDKFVRNLSELYADAVEEGVFEATQLDDHK